MKEEKQKTLSKEVRPLVKEVRESLPFIKNIIISPFAYGFAIGEAYLKEIKRKQKEAEAKALLIARQKEAEERQRKLEERKLEEASKIAQEQREEERQIRILEEKRKPTARKILHSVLAIASTTALITGVFQLVPIAIWTNHVNNCMKEELMKNNYELSFKERLERCNRR